MSQSPQLPTDDLSRERADLLQSLSTARHFLLHPLRELTDEQARLQPTVSELSLGGLVKHVTGIERSWVRQILEGPGEPVDYSSPSVEAVQAFQDGFRLLPHESLEQVIAQYRGAAAATDELVRTYPDLDAEQPLPEAPWFEPGARWSARRVLLHLIAEIAQHSGHADIIRESIDGAKSMG
jgi:uncharacterized damage-inducible protein DinB